MQDVYKQYENQPEVLKSLKKEQESFNKYVRSKNKIGAISNAKMTADSLDKVVRKIPVVFHVLYDLNDRTNIWQNKVNVETARLEDQIATLNEDFRRLNSNASSTPIPFQYTADSNVIGFGFTDVTTLVGADRYISIQAGPSIQEDFEFNIPTGDRLVIYFTNDDNLGVPTISNPHNAAIQTVAVSVQNLTTPIEVRDAVKTAIESNFSTHVNVMLDTTNLTTTGSQVPSLSVRNLVAGEAVVETNNMIISNCNIISKEVGRYIASDARIEFVLAKIGPDGEPTSGINRVYSDRSDMGNYSNNPANPTPPEVVFYNVWRNNMKSVIQWDPTKYFNIWSVENIPNSTGGTILGFAQFPDQLSYNVETDGVVLATDYLGETNNPGILGRTLSHEAGHWLNLQHIWGDDDTDNTGNPILDPVTDEDELEQILEGTDEVYDTPDQGNRTPNNCPTFIEVGEAGTLYGDMFMNYMDYSTDVCMSLFTFGQVERMRAAMDVYRSVIFSEENLMATGTSDNFDVSTLKPAVDFAVSKRQACVGETITLTSDVRNMDGSTTYTWTFPGSSLPSQSTNDASITFTESGTFDVQLEVTNANGTTTKLIHDAIYVAPNTTVLTAPLFFDFTNYSDVEGPTSIVTAISNDNFGGWKFASEQGNPNGNTQGAVGAMRVASYLNDEAEVQTLIVKPINTENLENGSTLTFDYATVKRTPSSDDRIRVLAKRDCDGDWKVIYENSTNPSIQNEVVTEGMAINNGQIQYLDYVPASSDWKTAEVRLPAAFRGKSYVQFKLELFGRDGNFFYLDNLNISGAPVSVDENEFESSFSVIPNPSNGNAVVEFELSNSTDVTLEIVDIIGKSYGAISEGMTEGKNMVHISNVASDLANGIYFAKITKNNRVYTQKFVVSK